MTDRVHPTQGDASSQLTSGAIAWAGHSDWIVPSGTDYLAAFAGLSGTPLNGFQESHSSSSFDVDIDTGEAFVGGRWMARDTTTTVTLASGTNNQTVYAGWESSAANSVVIGLDSAFSSSDDGRRTPIWEFDTDGSGVTTATQVHDTEPIHPHASDSDSLAGVDSSNYARTDVSEVFNAGISLSGNQVTDVGAVDSSASSAQLNLNPGGRADISLHSTASDSYVQMWDDYNSQVIAEFNVGGNVVIPNGNLVLDGNVLQNVALITSPSGQGELNLNPGGNADIAVQNSSSNGGYVQIWDQIDGKNLARFFQDGSAEISNGELSTPTGTVVTSSTKYEIQKNGSDASGVINFKT